MKDTVLLAYIGFDALFVTMGIAMLTTSLNMESEITETPDLDNVASNLILTSCPLKGSITTLSQYKLVLTISSCDCKWHSHVSCICDKYSSNSNASGQRITKAHWLLCICQCHVHDDNRSRYLVRDSQNKKESPSYLDCTGCINTELAPNKGVY